MSGHLCRCTGYRTVTDALREFVTEASTREVPDVDVAIPDGELAARASHPCEIHGENWHWIRPVTKEQLYEAILAHPAHALLGGATNSITYYKNLQGTSIATTAIPEFHGVAVTDAGMTLGAAVTVQELLEACRAYAKAHADQMSPAHALLEVLPRYRGKEARSVSTLAGELAIGTEVANYLTGLGATAAVERVTRGANGHPQVEVRAQVGLPQLVGLLQDRAAVTVITSVHLPFPAPRAAPEFYACYKLSRKVENMHHLLLAVFRVRLTPGADGLLVVDQCTLGFAKYVGWRSELIRDAALEATLVGRPWNDTTAREVAAGMPQRLQPLLAATPSTEDTAAHLDAYCATAGAGLFLRFYAAVARHMNKLSGPLADVRQPTRRSLMRDTQDWEHIPESDLTGTRHTNILMQSHATGFSRFTLDIELPANGLYGALVCSTHPHARLDGIDATEALKIEGVVAMVTARDIPGINKHTGIVMDTTVFADGEVECVGHPIALVMATSQPLAELAASKVVVHYTDLPAILSIDQAIAANSYLSGLESHKLVLGDVDATFAGRSDLVVTEGHFYTGGQEHWYLEGQNCLVVPRDEHYEVFSSTQNPSKVQTDVAGVLGIPRRRVTCTINHTGGGFGGKQDRPCILATAAAVGALKTGRPVRLALPRRLDFQMMGGRHPFRCDYKFGCTRDGKMVALKVRVVTDGGHCHDTTGPVLDKCVFQLPNAYTIPHIEIEGRGAKLNHPTNTAFRGFGAPQHCAMMEQIVEEMAGKLGMAPHQFRELNLNKPGDEILVGSYVSHGKGEAQLQAIWDQLMQTSEFPRRLAEVEAFNRQHQYVKRGISLIPLKNGVCFEEDFMNQGMALVHVLADGSVQVSHGGVEMGQGLNTKMAQIAAQTLGVPLDTVSVLPTCTDTCANTQPTAASSGTDLNGGAVREACAQIVRNLAPLRAEFPKATFAEICNKAYFGRVTLSAASHFKLPTLGWHWDTKTGFSAFYYDFGASVSEVEVDTLTGEFTILRSDLLEDAGRSLNPTLDLTQVEGGFMQGVGWLTMEEINWSLRSGAMLTVPFTYALPGLADTPLELHTALLKGHPCPENVAGSKSSGEAPVLLGTSVLMAIRHAIQSARADRGLKAQFTMDTPLTIEKIKLAIEGQAPSDLGDH
eukprot:GAFH01000718.1.p1 GENE.GAFH01000718.1~~GAFH01000718.1.p1  ORF type:complete len:1299 (-),score=542.67 GAFH01000718.1:173-3628(-)